MAVLLAAHGVRVVHRISLRLAMARRLSEVFFDHGVRAAGLLDRTHVCRHCDLLKQQAEQRKQRDPAMSTTVPHDPVLPQTWALA
ncbi:MAG: hypothetical protein IPG63_18265 [Xanthomonadales bacterium]|nr:hypothetical protein [Xanthomonadales bacterium]